MDARVPAPRLPLIHEFEGICHAGEMGVLPANRFHYCNRGNAKGNCASFPADLDLTAVRFTVTARTEHALTVLIMEEHNHWPGACVRIDFVLDGQKIEPEISEVCRRAQVLAFCRSYVEKTK